MILPTMNDYEKTYEAFRMSENIFAIAREHEESILDRFRRGSRFPYFNRIAWTDDKANQWFITFMCKSKKDAKIGKFWVLAYTIYEIPKLKKDSNGGKGVIAYDPYMMHRRYTGEKVATVFWDFVPHAINRYTERYLKPRELDNIELQRKVENIISRWWHFDVMGDKSSEKHKDKGSYPYDLYTHGGGMFRGNIVSEMLVRFFTYVADDMMFDSQKERQQQMNRERFRFKKDGIY